MTVHMVNMVRDEMRETAADRDVMFFFLTEFLMSIFNECVS